MVRLRQHRDSGNCLTRFTGDNYFGEDNCECLCNTCEKNCANGWSQEKDDESGDAPKPSIENGSPCKGYSLRARRRLQSETPSSRYQSETPDLNLRPHVPKGTPRSLSRFKNMGTPAGDSSSAEPKPRGLNLKRKRQSFLNTENSIENTESDEASEPPAKRRKSEVLNPSPLKEKTSAIDSIKVEEQPSDLTEAAQFHPSPITPLDASRRGSVSTTAEDGQTSTDATSVDEDTIVVEVPPSFIAAIPMAKNPEIPHPGPIEQAEAGETIVIGDSTSVKHPAVDSGIAAGESGLSERESVESDESQKDPRGSPKKGKKRSLEEDASSKTKEPAKKKKKRGVSLPNPHTETVRTVRIPGDYVLTPTLLAKPASAWINCKICEEPFVQEDAYFTRSSCPRCERHSKLYGYMWPKTDKEGRYDSEERILDHRTVHRFIEPAEERIVRKRNRSGSASRGLTREASEVSIEKTFKPTKAAKPPKVAKAAKADKPAKPVKSVKSTKPVKSARPEKSSKPAKQEKPEKVWIRGPYKKRAKPVAWEISDDEEEDEDSSDDDNELAPEPEEDEEDEDPEPEIRSRRNRVIKKARRTM